MYSLLQSSLLGNDLLEEQLSNEGYFQSKIVPRFWKHKTKKIQYVLVVDDFGIKYINRNDLDCLIATLEKHNDVAVNLKGKEFIKIELDSDNGNGKVHLSMKPYLQKHYDNSIMSCLQTP
jgi:hypothetical protein